MMGSFLRVTAAAALLFSSVSAFAFDNSRKGFLVSIGGGIHGVSVESNPSFGANRSESAGGFASSFKIGGGFTEQFSLYYIRNASWFDSQVSAEDTYMVLAGIGGIGGSYYFKPSSPSAYVMSAFGAGDYAAPFASNVDLEIGNAYLFGAGYEFSKHKMIEASMLFVDVEGSGFEIEDRSMNSFQLTFNYMWY